MLLDFAASTQPGDHDVCVVGGGPVGIALALACEDRGLSVLLVESGFDAPRPFPASLSSGHRVDPARHATPDVAICRALGGTSRWWGGRCVPLDDIDFEHRAHVPEARWPIQHAELARWYEPAARFLGLGCARFTSPASSIDLGEVRLDGLERWAPAIDIGAAYRARLAGSSRVRVLQGATVTSLGLSEDRTAVTRLTVASLGKTLTIAPRRVVLACGGLESTRLLLALRAAHPDAAGGPDGVLGQFYMGHASGRIADLVLDDPGTIAACDFFRDGAVFVRRRLTLSAEAQRRERLLNISLWADNPHFHAAGHASGVLSLVWLALASPGLGRRLVSEGVRLGHLGPRPWRARPHVANALRSPAATARHLIQILAARYLSSPRKPGFIVRSRDGRYPLHYHSEQAPNRLSRVRLSQRRDALGLRFLDIDLRFTEREARSVVRSHEIVDAALRRSGVGRLEFYDQPGQREASVLDQARDGFHQIGTTRMGIDPRQSVVDPDCRVHGIGNLYVASSSVFASSGQANPTFAAVALALRLASHLQEVECEPATALVNP